MTSGWDLADLDAVSGAGERGHVVAPTMNDEGGNGDLPQAGVTP
jgi:hypothetical protein